LFRPDQAAAVCEDQEPFENMLPIPFNPHDEAAVQRAFRAGLERIETLRHPAQVLEDFGAGEELGLGKVEL